MGEWKFCGAHDSSWSTGANVTDSIPYDVIRLFLPNLLNRCSLNIAPKFTRPLTEMSKKILLGVKAPPVRKADNLTAICEMIT
jgi:hypothetical protein